MVRKLTLVGLVVSALALLLHDRPSKDYAVGAQGRAAQAPHARGILVVDLRDDLDKEAASAFAREHGLDLRYSSETSEDEALLRAEVPDLAAALAKIKDDPRVEVAEPVVRMTATAYPDDPMYKEQWNLQRVGALEGWRVGGGRGITVAVLDTGVSPVEDLQGIRLEAGLSYVPGVAQSTDDHGHGTHVAGTIAQATHNGRGVAGVAPNVTLIPFKVLSAQGGGDSDQIAAAIDEAADQGVDIINLSLGGPHSEVLAKAAEDAARRGVLVVAAAGNSGREGVSCPASGPAVIAVSATGPSGELAPYSTHGEGVEIAAPGGDLRQPGGGITQDTLGPGGEHAYLAFQGTSMATPHVSGALAVLRGMGLSPRAATQALFKSAKDKGGVGYDTRYGHGELSVEAAVEAVTAQRGRRFFAAGALALALALLMGFKPVGALGIVFTSAASAGGLFFLTRLPLDPSPLWQLLSADLLSWPTLLLSEGWTHNALISSAAPIAVMTFTLGLIKKTSMVTSGIAMGVGVALISAGLHGSIEAFSSGWLNATYLVVNGGVCVAASAVILLSRKMGYSI